MKQWRMVAMIGLFALLAGACGTSAPKKDADAGKPKGGTQVNVEVKQWTVSPSPASASSGSVEFVAKNTGTMEHELVVLKTDLAFDALPAEGSKVAETGGGVEKVGEIEEFSAGATKSVTFDLKPGNYVLICNIEGHYQSGMHAAFEVR